MSLRVPILILIVSFGVGVPVTLLLGTSYGIGVVVGLMLILYWVLPAGGYRDSPVDRSIQEGGDMSGPDSKRYWS